MNKKNDPLVSVVVLNWNGLSNTKKCLDSLARQTFKNFEVIVVDNGSKESEKKYLRDLKDITLVDNPKNRGFTGGHIDGLKVASGKYILLLNNDAVLSKDYLSVAVNTMDSDETIGAVGGRAYFWDKKNPVFSTENQYYSYQEIDPFTGEARTLSTDYGTKQVVNNVSGSSVLVRRSVVNEIGYLYEPFFAYFEETDLFARMKRAGYKVIYNPELHIWHKNGASSGGSSGSYFFYYQIFKNRFVFALRNFELSFLLRFLKNYLKIAAASSLKLVLSRGDHTMNKAYSAAALQNIMCLPRAVLSRLRLNWRLGKTKYNQTLMLERAKISIVLDCSNSDRASLRKLTDQLLNKTNPAFEYILLVKKGDALFPERVRGVRFVEDCGYFKVHPMNLACLAAEHDWMVLSDEGNIPESDVIVAMLGLGIESRAELIVNLLAQEQRSPYVLLNKSLFERMGGLGKKKRLQSCINSVIQYASIDKTLQYSEIDTPDSRVRIYKPNRKQYHETTLRIQYDKFLLRENKQSLIDKLTERHYRLYQVRRLSGWLISRKIDIRQKLGRIKNVALYIFSLRFDLLKRESQHMINERVRTLPLNRYAEETKKIYPSAEKIARRDPTNIVVFIICYERVLELKKLVSWLKTNEFKRIVFIDNGSSYPGILEFFSESEDQTIRLYRNIGHKSPWTKSIVRALLPDEYYIVTDPDVIPVESQADELLETLLDTHRIYDEYLKVGLGLKIDDIPSSFKHKKHVQQWERQFWQNEISQNIFEAGVDTTFALYKPCTFNYTLNPSLRLGGDHVARHMPWYKNSSVQTEEDKYYSIHANKDITSWSLDQIPARYLKEISNEKV